MASELVRSNIAEATPLTLQCPQRCALLNEVVTLASLSTPPVSAQRRGVRGALLDRREPEDDHRGRPQCHLRACLLAFLAVLLLRREPFQTGTNSYHLALRAPQKACGVLPGLQKLAFAGKKMHDPARTLEQCAAPHRARRKKSCLPLLPPTAQLRRRRLLENQSQSPNWQTPRGDATLH